MVKKISLFIALIALITISCVGQKEIKVIQINTSSDFQIVTGNDFKGAIIPAGSETNFNKSQLAKRFTPTKEDIIKAEFALTENYNRSMKRDSRVYDFKRIENVRSHFKDYIRQYLGYVNEKGEQIIWIHLVRHEKLQQEIENIELDWKSEIISGLGDVFYENMITLTYNKNTGKLTLW